MADGVIPTEEAFRRIAQATREVEALIHRAAHIPQRRVIPSTRKMIEGFLDGDLGASSDDGETEATATLSVWSGNGSAWADTERNVTVTNRNDGFSASAGDYVLAMEMGGENRVVAPSAGCPPRNELWVIVVGGSPTGGTFDVDVRIGETTETIELAYDDTSSEVITAFEGHSGIASGDIGASGGPFPDSPIIIEFKGNLAAMPIAEVLENHPVWDFSLLTGGSGLSVTIVRQVPGGFAGN